MKIASPRLARLMQPQFRGEEGTPPATPPATPPPADPVGEIKSAIADIRKLAAEGNDVAKAKLSALETRLAAMEAAMQTRKFASVPGTEDVAKQFSFQRAIKFALTGEAAGCELERDVHLAACKALATTPDAAGGYIVPVEIMASEMIPLLRAKVAAMQLGARVLTGLTGGEIRIPKQTAAATAYWVGENSAPTASDQTLGQISLRPHTCAALTKVSNRLIMLANPSAEQLVRNDLASQLGLAMDLGFLDGTGAAGQPLGVGRTTGVVTSSGLGALDITDLLTITGAIEDNNAAEGALGFACSPAIYRSIRKIHIAQYSGQTAAQNPGWVFPPLATPEQFAALTGLRFATTTQLTAAGAGANQVLIYGNWNDLLIAQWGGMTIEASTQTGDSSGSAFTSRQTWVMASTEVDCAVRHTESFYVATNVTA